LIVLANSGTIAWLYDLPKATLKDKTSRLLLESAANKFELRAEYLTAMRNIDSEGILPGQRYRHICVSDKSHGHF
jgi:hypothetical protein